MVAEGKVSDIAGLLRRVSAQGTTPTKLCIDGLRHFRQLLALASDPEGAAAAAGRARPPINFKRRDSVIRQAQALGRERIERALALLVETDLTLRSSSRAPQEALVERALIRIAMSSRAR